MSRRKVKLRPIACATRQDAMWTAIRQLALHRGTFTAAAVARLAKCSHNHATTYLRALERAGMVERAGTSEGPVVRRLARDVGVEAPRLGRSREVADQPTGYERMWQAIKALGAFSRRDLRVATQAAETSVRRYVAALHRAGYLALLPGPSRGPRARFRLVPSRNTGPRPPKVERDGGVFDLNLGRRVWPAEERAEAGDG